MKKVTKHHHIIDLGGKTAEEWLFIDCAFIESGVRYAQESGCKRIMFGSLDDKQQARKVGIDVLERLPGLEGIMWQLPIPKKANFSPLMAQIQLKYLAIGCPDLAIDLAAFPDLEFFDFRFSEAVTGYDKASPSLRNVRVSHLSSELGFLGAVGNLAKLSVLRSDIKTLAGIEKLTEIEELELVLCRKLESVSHAKSLNKLCVLHLDGCSRMSNLSDLKEFHSLKTFWLKAGAIESCQFISSMRSIQFASINAAILDNSLAPLLESKTLREVHFSPMKRTYSPKLSPDDLNRILAARRSSDQR